MKIDTSTVVLLITTSTLSSVSGFNPSTVLPGSRVVSSSTSVFGYLDDLTDELYAPADTPDVDITLDNTKLPENKKENYGPAGFEDYVDFGDEFDGGDGQMGVAGDGNKGLEKIGAGPAVNMKSKTMSAKNAWGTDTGYADSLREQGMDTQKAQRMENWQNQQAVRNKQINHLAITEGFDEVREDAELDWRDLAAFGVDRVDDFDLDEAFGAVTAGDDYETVLLTSRIGKIVAHNFDLKNELMGFADFRAAFTEKNMDYAVTPNEGALKSSEALAFSVKFRPNNPGTSEATLVIETEDMKKTYKFIGTTG